MRTRIWCSILTGIVTVVVAVTVLWVLQSDTHENRLTCFQAGVKIFDYRGIADLYATRDVIQGTLQNGQSFALAPLNSKPGVLCQQTGFKTALQPTPHQ